MNQPVLIGFGDSWAAGHDLAVGEKSYLELLANKNQIPFYNFAVGSSSVPHLVLQFQKFIETVYSADNQYYAIFFLTAKERNFCFDTTTKEIVHLGPWSDPFHDYYKFYNNEYGDFVFNTSILTLQRLCSLYNIQDHYMLGWQLNDLWNTIDQKKFWHQGQKAITQLFCEQDEFVPLFTLLQEGSVSKNKYFGKHPTQVHPNQLGHMKIAEALADWIKFE